MLISSHSPPVLQTSKPLNLDIKTIQVKGSTFVILYDIEFYCKMLSISWWALPRRMWLTINYPMRALWVNELLRWKEVSSSNISVTAPSGLIQYELLEIKNAAHL